MIKHYKYTNNLSRFDISLIYSQYIYVIYFDIYFLSNYVVRNVEYSLDIGIQLV